MNYEDLSEEAKDVLKGMVEFCVSNNVCMGQDEGFDLQTEEKHPFRKELEKFVDI